MKVKSIIAAAYIMLGFIQHCNGQGGTLIGSKHDFSIASSSWSINDKVTSKMQGHSCNLCHAGIGNYLDSTGTTTLAGRKGPIWNHKGSGNYKIYSEGYNFWREGGQSIGNPEGSSKLCLSCHDGTVALSNFRMFEKMTISREASLSLGVDLSRSHPISFTYDSRLAIIDRKLWDPTTTRSGVHGGTIDEDMLEDHKVECVSCHDVHNHASNDHFLIKSNMNSELCFTCHRM